MECPNIFKYLDYRQGEFPVCERAANEVLSIPVFPELDPLQAERIAHIIRKAVQ